MKRREFIKKGCSAAALLSLNPQAALANPKRDPAMVFILLRGGADLLSFIPPLEDPLYAVVRPTIGLSEKGGTRIRLSAPFYLHPRASDLVPLWKARQLAFVLQTGAPLSSKSHSDAEERLQLGGFGVGMPHDGFLHRALGGLRSERRIRAVALQETTPLSLVGGRPGILSFGSLNHFSLVSNASAGLDAAAVRELYETGGDELLDTAVHSALAAMKELEPLRTDSRFPEFLKSFPRGIFGQRLGEIGWLLKHRTDIPLFVTQLTGWDTHALQGAEGGASAQLIGEFSAGLSALSRALGPRWKRTLVVAVTEFGRRVAENGSRGTDHGHASLAIVAGGGVRGGKMYGSWTGLKKENLFEGRDLPVTTDCRQVLAECLARHLQVSDVGAVFPGWGYDPAKNLRLLG